MEHGHPTYDASARTNRKHTVEDYEERRQLVLKDLTDTSVLPVITEGSLSGCFLVNVIKVVIPLPRLPKLVKETWNWLGDDTSATLNNLWVAVDASWVRSRMADRNIKMADALYDIINLCGLSSVGEKKGLKKSLVRVSRAKAFVEFDQLLHDGTGFEAGEHPAVLVIKRLGKTDKPVLSVVGDPEVGVSFDFGEVPKDPLANILAFPKKD